MQYNTIQYISTSPYKHVYGICKYIYICTYTTYIEYSISLPKRNVGYTKISKNSLHENLDHGNRSGQTPCWDPQVAWESGKKQRRWAAGHLAMAAGRSLEFPSELRIWCLERMMRDSSSWCHYFRDLWTKDVLKKTPHVVSKSFLFQWFKNYMCPCVIVCVCYQVCFFVRKRWQAICVDARLSVLNGAHVLGSQNDVSKAPSNLEQLQCDSHGTLGHLVTSWDQAIIGHR